MKASAFLIIPLLLSAASCGDSSAGHDAENATQNSPQAAQAMHDEEIIRLVYDPAYNVPDNFYIDDRANSPGSFTIHHVLDESNSFELCTDDYQSALDIEAADNASRAVSGTFVSAVETDRYFEVVRELAYTDGVGNITDPTSPGYSRVFRCSSIRRDGVDRHLLNGYAGVINSRPIDARAIREFTEYLWQFRFFATGRRVVLTSVGESTATSLEHVLALAFRTSQGQDQCDLIEIAEWRFSVARSSGEVSKTFRDLRSFEAKLEAGTPVICQ
jgi:hypothetical protein